MSIESRAASYIWDHTPIGATDKYLNQKLLGRSYIDLSNRDYKDPNSIQRVSTSNGSQVPSLINRLETGASKALTVANNITSPGFELGAVILGVAVIALLVKF